jgi:hypothetical protein
MLLRSRSITNGGISKLGRLSLVRELCLSGCERLGDRGLLSLIHSGGLQNLSTLSLVGCDELSAISLRAIATLPALKTLNLEMCGGVHDGLQFLASAAGLVSLNVGWCNEVCCSLNATSFLCVSSPMFA